ncbi:DUF1761 domain-containing protein [Candidatus Kaiserbacteria bacterium]|nr:DUF1761 domain-containing protein [Candidatus Kaiserbacteria bacterium]
MEIPINYLAVLAAAISNMVLGFLWYGPLFGKMWSQLMGWGEMTPEKMAEMQKKARSAYAASFVGALVMSYVLAHAIIFGTTYTQMFGVLGGMTGAFWYWLGFVAPVTVGSVLWDGKPWKLWFINAGYYLAAMLVMGAILGGWTA